MSTLQLGRAYPIDERPMKTKRNHEGNKFEFRATFLQLWLKHKVRVWGRDEDGVWCRRTYKFNKLPKWLRRGIKKIGKMQAKAQPLLAQREMAVRQLSPSGSVVRQHHGMDPLGTEGNLQ